MTVKEKLYTVDDLWDMEHDPAYEDRYFYLIDGMLFEDEIPGRTHGRLAVEILSPNDTLAKARRKAQVHLDNGTALVWIVQPNRRGIHVCRAAGGGGLQTDFVGQGDTLSGEDVLPGFALEVSKIFAVIRV